MWQETSGNPSIHTVATYLTTWRNYIRSKQLRPHLESQLLHALDQIERNGANIQPAHFVLLLGRTLPLLLKEGVEDFNGAETQ